MFKSTHSHTISDIDVMTTMYPTHTQKNLSYSQIVVAIIMTKCIYIKNKHMNRSRMNKNNNNDSSSSKSKSTLLNAHNKVTVKRFL